VKSSAVPRLGYVLPALVLVVACGSEGATESGGEARRVIDVKALDTLRFDPATIGARAGERVTFRVVNTGIAPHEFVIGDTAFHDGHEAAASASAHAGHAAGGDGAAVYVVSGETKTVDYTMPAQPPTFACHVDGHDDAGMTGTVTY